ncbi:MAG: flagellar basal body P-ring protein FlgI [Sphingomonadales bacterium]|nr:flagellar basal body P-ring protein FlgI [Sphingomonadales bacterium]
MSVVDIRPAEAASRIKDIVAVEGVRENQLVGYGLVVGLNGTGDSLRNSPFTRQSLEAMLERLGLNTRGTNMQTDNVAAVMVTGHLPAFARQGSRVDVLVSAMGDAQDLRGGTLLVTPLMGADGEVYAVAQGSVAVAGFSAGGDAESITQGVPTSGRIANGAIVERELAFEFAGMQRIHLSLYNPDFTTAKRIAQAINNHLGASLAVPLDPATVRLSRPANTPVAMFDLLSSIEQLEVTPDQPARVVIDERSGIIVMGSEVKINTVAIAQGNLTIRVTETPQVSQPTPFSEGGQTEVVPRTEVAIDTADNERLAIVSSGVSLQDLVDGLNALGVGPRDMITILQAIKAAGAMQAEIEAM